MPASTPSVDVASLATRLRTDIWRLARRLRSEAHVDLTPTLQSALGTLDRHGPMTPGTFARHEQIRKPTATRTIAALLDLGLVERTPDPLDGRVAWLQLSPDGRRLVQRMRRRYDAYLAERMKRLPGEDLAVLGRAAAILEAITAEDPEVRS
ncbi:MAG TPA: MarR family transcriptional regulator [Actinomycetota bacterium]|nr:MarR family transcriptional regulator [Actinomycetota bacterium]